jgi:lipopolysaccharide export system protein LptA
MTAPTRPVLPLLAAALIALAAGPGPALAQSLGLGALEGEAPLEVLADDGIEWQRDAKLFIAEGNARAKRGDVTVHARRLVAHYREAADGGSNVEIYRLEASGAVRIVSTKEQAVGESAIYDIDRQVFVLTGGDLSLTTPEARITAQESLEYWTERELAVARGGARAFGEQRLLSADVLTARFERDSRTGESAIDRIEAFDNVEIRTAEEVVRGDRGVYQLSTRIASLAGSVKITRGQNQLNGDLAEVNLQTGVSRLRAAPGGKPSRVFGLIRPERADPDQNSTTTDSPASKAP